MQQEVLPQPNTPSSTQEWKRFFKELLETLLLAAALFLVINLVSARVRVDGFSMRPTLDNGEYVLVVRWVNLFGGYQRGDVVIFRPPMYPPESFFRRLLGLPDLLGDNYEDYIKRIIGMPGETVRIEPGRVSINGVELIEPYLAAPIEYSGEWTVPADSYFVLGDNRNNSADSHHWGFLPAQNVLGKAVLIYWPFSAWAVLNSDAAVLAAP